MRVVLITHGLPPYEYTGVETHVAHSARALAAAGVEVLVLARRSVAGQPHLAERRERAGDHWVHWLNDAEPTRDAAEAQDPPGVLAAFEDFLERECPDLCHFHHLQGFGPACVEAAQARGIATVFTAHDFGALCHRNVLLRPDLAQCERVGGPQACARCDLATSLLNSLPELGDWQAGVAPDSLAPATALALAEQLEGSEPEGLQPARATRVALDEARRGALQTCDLVLAPSALMAARLRELDLCPEQIREHACGVDLPTLLRVPRFEPGGDEPLRFGFIGGASKHKGLAVLLEAFADLRERAQLHVFADSTDGPHVAHLRQLANRAGAAWHGAFEARDLPRVLAEIDVLCVPSQWEENAPFVVREAFAAGRPVVASRLGGLLESVRDGRDGLLVDAADRAAWTGTLDGLAGDRDRVLELAAGIAPPADIATSTRTLIDLYGEMLERRDTPQSPPLPHLAALEARHRDLAGRPLAELADTVAQGFERLTAGLGEDVSVAPPDLAPELDEALRDRLRDERRRLEWLERDAAAQGLARGELERELTWLRAQVRDREAELAGTRDSLEDAQAEVIGHAAELERLRTDRAALAEEHTRLAADLTARREHDAWLAKQNAELGERVAQLEQLAGELDWRRREMDAARGAGGWLWRALLRRSGLGRRMSDWGDAE